MSLSPVTIACPHCRREYEISIDLAKLSRITSRASCARCKKVFEVTPDRIQARAPATRSTEYRRETPLAARVASTDITRSRTDSRRRSYEERASVRRTEDDPRDVRRPTEDRDVIRRAAVDERRNPGRAADDPAGDNRTESRELRRADSRTESRELRRADSRTESRELRRADSRTDSRELRRTTPADTVDVGTVNPANRDGDVSIARTLSVRGARTERLADNVANLFRVPDVAPVAPRVEPSVDDPETAWLVIADPGLGALTVEQSEAASALEWLLTHAVGARREA